jgi:serine/threonine protein kinase
MSFAIGDTVGQYQIVEQIGQGGMATVFKAYHANLDRFVALKVLHPALKEDPNFLERFRREAQIIARLDHPSIVPVYDYASHEGRSYLVMKFVDGETLKARLKTGALTQSDMIRLLDSVAQALTYAHSQNILHRDIKPSNIMLDRQNTPFITDFGLARIAQSGESTLSQDMMLGTPQYISPEQAKGLHDLGPGTDIYSLGIVIYEMIVGRVPFNADTPFATIHDHIYKPLPLPSKINRAVPLPIEQILLKALAKEPQDRYPSAIDMVDALREAMESAGVTELGAIRYRSAGTTLSPTASTIPESALHLRAEQKQIAVPSPYVHDFGSSTTNRQAYRRRANLWILSGIGALLLTCLASVFVILSAISDEELCPWNISNTDEVSAADPEDDAVDRLPIFTGVGVPLDQAQTLVDANPDEPAGYFYLALAEFDAGDREAGISNAVHAITHLNASSELIAAAARTATINEQFEIATWLYLETLTRENLPPETRNEAGEFVAGRIAAEPASTRALINQYLERRPPAAAVYAMQALALLQANWQALRHQARSSVERALELDDTLAEAYLARGLLFLASGQPQEAMSDWRYAIAFDDAPDWVTREAHRLIEETESRAS